MDIQQQKKLLREQMKFKKAEIPFDEKCRLSQQIFALLENDPHFINAHTVLIYWAMKDEVQTQDFIFKWKMKKHFVLPVVNNDKLELREFTDEHDLEKSGAFSLLEPKSNALIPVESIDLVIVPGVAFDRQGNRLGRGKAYYDKLLKNTKLHKIGVCFAQQLINNIPVESSDIAMDKVIFK